MNPFNLYENDCIFEKIEKEIGTDYNVCYK